MLAFEGGLALISAIKTAEKVEIAQWVYNTQIGLLLTISIFAGLGQSLGLIQGIGETFIQNFSYFLVFVVGVGASFAAWFSGEILGVQLQKFSLRKEEATEKFSEQSRIYIQNARKKFLENTEQNKELLPQPAEHRTSHRSSVRIPRLKRTSHEVSEKVSLIFSELEKAQAEENRILQFAELAELLRNKYPDQNFASDGYISTKRNDWLDQNSERLQ